MIFKQRHPVEFNVTSLIIAPFGSDILIRGIFTNSTFGRWQLYGEIASKEASAKVRLLCQDFYFSNEVMGFLSDDISCYLDDYAPEGLASIDVICKLEPFPEICDHRILIKTKNMAITYNQFPYRFDNVCAEIELKQDGFIVKNGVNKCRDTVAWISGECHGYELGSPFLFTIGFKNLKIDEKLKNALGEDGKKIWDEIKPEGVVDVYGSITKKRGGEEKLNLQICIKKSTFLPELFPYPIKNASGLAILNKGRVFIKGIRASHGDSEIIINGQIDRVGEGKEIEIMLSAKNLKVDRKLKNALGADAEDFWKNFSPDGYIDLNIFYRKAGELKKSRFEIKCKKGSIKYKNCPFPLHNIRGFVEYKDGVINLRGLDACYKNSIINISGQINTKDGKTRLKISANNIHINEEFISNLPEGVAAALKSIGLEGNSDFELDLFCAGAKQERIKYSLNLKIRDGKIAGKPEVKFLSAECTLLGKIASENHFSTGIISISKAISENIPFYDVAITFSASNGLISICDIKAITLEGRLEGVLSVDTEGQKFNASFNLSDANLYEFTSLTGRYPEKRILGRCRLAVNHIAWRSGELETLSGQGTLTITEGYLGELPFFAKIFTLDPTRLLRRSPLETGFIDFRIDNRGFNLRGFIFEGKETAIVGTGRIDFEGNLSLLIRMQTHLGIRLPGIQLLERIIDLVKDPLYATKVSGTFDNPTFSPRFLPGPPKPVR
jgi:hypothetical protein